MLCGSTGWRVGCGGHGVGERETWSRGGCWGVEGAHEVEGACMKVVECQCTMLTCREEGQKW